MTVTDTAASAEAFTGRVLTDTAAATTVVLAALGDRLGLFTDLAAHGAATSGELAARTGTDERYVREWAAGMVAAGYLERDPVDGRIVLPAAHVPTLATEGGTTFLGGVHQELVGAIQRYHDVAEAFRTGGGVATDDLHEDVHLGTARFTAAWHDHLVSRQWLPLVPDVEAPLRAGARVADVGCGSGLGAVRLAQNFAAVTVVGYDVHAPNVARATAAAEAAGVADRVRFVVADAADGLPERYDVVTTFDVVHDAVNPLRLMRSVHDALVPGGVHLCLEINCSDRPEDNVGPVAALLYGFSVLYCMTASLAQGGDGLGTLGLPESRLRELGLRAGFAEVRRVDIDNPFNSLYTLRRADRAVT
ncbi:MAG: SAM-dependent methyltransferase [Pseudonocardiaceae bacterium]|nr:MAG: SAM-dependent methyltransferase [Pseudonocardiaceae bacterium]